MWTQRYDAEQLDSQTTSGSLGRSLRMYATLEESLRLRAGLWSAWLSLGITVKDRLFMMAADLRRTPCRQSRAISLPCR